MAEWTESEDVRLDSLWREGHSTLEIGRRLGRSKNSIIGRAHRLELPDRPSPIRRDGMPGRSPRRQASLRVRGPTLPSMASAPPLYVEKTAEQIAAARARPIAGPTLAPLASAEIITAAPSAPRLPARVLTCCWPEGEPGTRSFRFCEAPCATGSRVYCDSHAKRSYVRVRDRREDADVAGT